MSTKARAALQTFHAIQASDLAAALNDAFKQIRFQPGDYGAELTAPEGPSTAGGVQAMQHLRLVARQAGYPTLVVGHANHADGRAELRTYDHFDAVYRRRFRRPAEIDRAQYDDFIRLARQLLEALHLKTTIADTPTDLELEHVRRGGRAGWRVTVAVAVVIALAGIGAWRLGLWRALLHG